MEQKLLDQICRQLQPKESLTVCEWAKRNIVIPHDYSSPIRGAWSLDLFPYYAEPLSKLDVPSVRQITNLKISQGGGSQNLLLPVALYLLSQGKPVIFVSGQQEATEQFRLERFLPLVKASPAFAEIELYDRGTETYLSNGGLISFVHSSSKQGVKTRPGYVICDEVDCYSHAVIERLRSRMTQYPNAKLIAISTADDEAERTKIKTEQGDRYLTPIFLEWADSSQAYYYLQGKTGKPFRLQFGFPEDGKLPPYGVKWSQDAYNDKTKTWNLARVAESVHYIDEAGNSYSDAELKALLSSGHWIHTKPELSDIHPGYQYNCLYLHAKPLKEVALDYLRAKRQGGTVYRTYMLEQWAEEYEQAKIEITDRALAKLQTGYKRGNYFYAEEPYKTELAGKPTVSIMGVDVQKAHCEWLVIDICGDYVAVRDWGRCFTFAELNDISLKLRVNHVVTDIRYATRRAETYEACGTYRLIPCMMVAGLDKGKRAGLPFEVVSIDPMSGKKGQGKGSIAQLYFGREIKVSLFEMMGRQHHTKLLLPQDTDQDLETQLTNEKVEVKEDGQIGWDEEAKRNHLFDSLTYAFAVARFKRYLLP